MKLKVNSSTSWPRRWRELPALRFSDVKAFVKWLEDELSYLIDERAVLKHFLQWPEKKADAMREAACSYRDLKNLESEVSSFVENNKPQFPVATALKRAQALQDK